MEESDRGGMCINKDLFPSKRHQMSRRATRVEGNRGGLSKGPAIDEVWPAVVVLTRHIVEGLLPSAKHEEHTLFNPETALYAVNGGSHAQDIARQKIYIVPIYPSHYPTLDHPSSFIGACMIMRPEILNPGLHVPWRGSNC